MEKTRKVNVILFYDDEQQKWLVALNLPEVPLSTKVLTPYEAGWVAEVLNGQTMTSTVASQMSQGGYRFREIMTYLKRNIEPDLYPEIARQIKNMVAMAEFSQAMIERPVEQAAYVQ
jgi:hypothetical protein